MIKGKLFSSNKSIFCSFATENASNSVEITQNPHHKRQDNTKCSANLKTASVLNEWMRRNNRIIWMTFTINCTSFDMIAFYNSSIECESGFTIEKNIFHLRWVTVQFTQRLYSNARHANNIQCVYLFKWSLQYAIDH